MKKPAARLSDMHTCPIVAISGPHVGGPLMPGCCTTVLIGKLPAARIGDQAACIGPPDLIVEGSLTVKIGGQCAARVGDATSHGGVLASGWNTVLIGG